MAEQATQDVDASATVQERGLVLCFEIEIKKTGRLRVQECMRQQERQIRPTSFVIRARPMADTSAFGTPECALSIEAQLFRWQRQGGNDTCADCGSVVAIDWCSISAAAAATGPVSALTYASASALADPDHDPHRWAVTLCPACAGVHRAMGRQLCQVLSLTMDSWTLALVRRCVTFGPRFAACLALCSSMVPFP